MKKTTALVFYFAFILVSGNNKSDSISLNSSFSDSSKTTFPKIMKKSALTITSKTIPTTKTTTTTTSTKNFVTASQKPEINFQISTTTPVPQPLLKSPIKPWNVTIGNETVIATMAVQLIIPYIDTNNKKSIVTINMPSDEIEATGNFSTREEIMRLSWKSGTAINNSIELDFKLNEKTYSFESIKVFVQSPYFPHPSNSSGQMNFFHKLENFNITLGMSYHCAKKQIFNLTNVNDTGAIGKIIVTDLQIQAFKKSKKENFDIAEDCVFEVPDAVPIAVGCILASLVVIVLALYLISRRRSQHARGYLSM